MNIQEHKLKNGKTTYWFRIYLGVDPLTGKKIQTVRRGFRSKREAETAYMRLKVEAEGKTLTKRKRYKFKEMYEGWLPQYELTVKESTYGKTVQLFRAHILPRIGDYYIDAIKLSTMQKCVNEWFKIHSGYKKIFRYARRVFKYAITIGVINSDPCEYVIYPVSVAQIEEGEREGNYYDKKELESFMKHAEADLDLKWFTVFRLLAFTGIRKGELLALTWEDIDLKDGVLRIRKTLTLDRQNRIIVQTPKTKESVRDIDLDHKTIGILKEWRAEQVRIYSQLGINAMRKEQLVFSNYKNEFMTLPSIGHKIDALVKKYDLKRITPHGFRHTHCSMLFEAGASIPQVQARLGHRDIHTTMNIYNHVTKRQKEEVVEKLTAYLAF